MYKIMNDFKYHRDIEPHFYIVDYENDSYLHSDMTESTSLHGDTGWFKTMPEAQAVLDRFNHLREVMTNPVMPTTESFSLDSIENASSIREYARKHVEKCINAALANLVETIKNVAEQGRNEINMTLGGSFAWLWAFKTEKLDAALEKLRSLGYTAEFCDNTYTKISW